MRTQMLMRRKALKLTQEDVAKRAGMTRANYAHIERGRHNPSIEQMKEIAKALKVKPDLNFFENDCDETYHSDVDDEPQTA